jgi:hypothetical protein
MGLFGFGKKDDDVVDLSEHYRKKQEAMRVEQGEQSQSEGEQDVVDMQTLGNLAAVSNVQKDKEESKGDSEEAYLDISGSVEEKRKKLAKRIVGISSKLEEISTQVYHLQQRVEVLERKGGVARE